MVEPSRRPQVVEQLDQMEGVLAEQVEAVAALRARLADVLRPEEPAAGEERPSGELVPLAGRIRDIMRGFQGVTQELGAMIRRVEL
jgi:hypothetical protein